MPLDFGDLGPVTHVSDAVGLTVGGGLNDDWFSRPGYYFERILSNPTQRAALVEAIDGVFAGDATTDASGRQWVPILEEGAVQLALTLHEDAAKVATFGFGVRVHVTSPEVSVTGVIPILRVPEGGSTSVAFGTTSGRIELAASVRLPSGGILGGVGVRADIPTASGGNPSFSVVLEDLALPGASGPTTVALGEDGLADLGHDALRLLTGLLRAQASAAGDLASAILSLIGLGGGGNLPGLPIEDLLTRGLPALTTWVESIIRSSTAVDAWLGHLHALLLAIGVSSLGPVSDGRIAWTLASGASAGLTLRTRPAAGNDVTVEIGGDLRWTGASTSPPADLGVEVSLLRFTIGASPSLIGLPSVVAAARLGPASGTTNHLLPVVTATSGLSVGARAFRLGVSLDESRSVGAVLALEQATVGSRTYPSLDLTNVDAITDIAGTALTDFLNTLLGGLGAAGDAAKILLGIAAPSGGSPVDLVTVPELIAAPLDRVRRYHEAFLAADQAKWAGVLSAVVSMLGVDPSAAVTGAGSEAEPWTLPLDGPVAVRGWLEGSNVLHLGLALDKRITDLAGSCPTLRVLFEVELARIDLSGGLQPLPRIEASLRFGARGGVPLRVGLAPVFIVTDSIGVRVGLVDGHLRAGIDSPGLAAEIEGESVPLSLPRRGSSGSLEGDIPWRTLELLAGVVLGEIPAAWARGLAELAGWRPGRPTALSLQELTSQPLSALRSWTERVEPADFAQFVALLVRGVTGDDLARGPLLGRGDPRDPFAVPLRALDAVASTPLLSLVLDGTVTAPDADWFRPDGLVELALGVHGGGTAHELIDRIADTMFEVATRSPEVQAFLQGRDNLAEGLRALHDFWADSDGIVGAAASQREGATHHAETLAHDELPAAPSLAALLADVAPKRLVYVGLRPAWGGGLDERATVDLSAAGRAPESFDLTELGSRDGPWYVRLPLRVDTTRPGGGSGLEEQAARLARVIATVRDHAGGDVTLVAHGPAGFAALAAATTGVERVITLGTPHGGIDLSILEAGAGAAALQALRFAIPDFDPSRAEIGAALRGRALLAPLVRGWELGIAASEWSPPATVPTLPAGLQVHTIGASTPSADVVSALAALAGRVLQAAFESRATFTPGPLAIGLQRRWSTGTDVRVRSTVSLMLWKAGETAIDDPQLRVRLAIERPGGHLVGGPDPTRADGVRPTPSVRRAEIEIEVPLRRPAETTCAVVLVDAEALGVRRARWVISATVPETDTALDAAARVLVGRVFAALGPVPSSGAARALLEACDALRLLDASSSDAAPALSVEAMERLIEDPGGLWATLRADRGAAGLARAVAALVGAPVPSTSTPTSISLTLDGVILGADLASGAITVATDLTMASGLKLAGTLSVSPSAVTGQGTITAGPLSIEIAAPGPTVRLVLPGASPVPLFPTPDVAGLAHLVEAAAPAGLLWGGIHVVRSLDPAVNAVLDPLLRALGLLRGTDPSTETLAVPFGLFHAPVAWLTDAATLGGAGGQVDVTRLRDLVLSLGTLAGLTKTAANELELGFGMTLGVTPSDGRAKIALGIAPATGASVRVAGTVGVVLPGGGHGVDASVGISIAPPGAGPITSASRLTAELGTAAVSLRLELSGGTRIDLYPAGPGLADLGAAAVDIALPLLLDEVVTRAGTVGTAIAGVGDALGLRVSGKFDAAQIKALAADPGTELGNRLSSNLSASFGALETMLTQVLPSGWTAHHDTAGHFLELAVTGAGSLRLTAPAGLGATLTVPARTIHDDGTVHIDLSIDLAVSSGGLTRAHLRVEIPPAHALPIGPISLAPLLDIDIGGGAVDGPHVSIGLATTSHTVAGRVSLAGSTPSFALVPASGGDLATSLFAILVAPAVDFAISLDAVKTALDSSVPVLLGLGTAATPTVRSVLSDVLLNASGTHFDPGVLDPGSLLTRALRLGVGLADAALSVTAGPVKVAVVRDGSRVGIGLTLPPGSRLSLGGGDVTVALEVDETWIKPQKPPGITVMLVDTSGTPSVSFSMLVAGVGIRIGRTGGPLLDAGLTIDSIAIHGYLEADGSGVTDGGGQVELAGLAIPLGGATGGSDKVASGVISDAAGSGKPPATAFSPALAVQVGDSGVRVGFRAGPGDGPWWLRIQRAFGPVYLEQMGLGVTYQGDRLETVTLLIDAGISIAGLAVAVDDLAITANVAAGLGKASSWSVSMAGLAVSADTSGLQISGGLRKLPDRVDYVGMLTVRFGQYGLSVYGGYGIDTDARGDYTSFFLYGALNAPIGGPPCFFVTGIAAGGGINRRLVLPTDFDEMASYPLIRALDMGAPMPSKPMDALAELGKTFPSQRGRFWIAAGVSFNSFALIDGVAVIGLEIGDGFELSLLGLVRAALPRPQLALVSIELALLARFNSREGVLWIQGQLTDNSWLLTKSCRLTGGFAYVMWFRGDKAGEFVLTLGGYHPLFRREGYPEVPRLGFVWSIGSALVIKGESYFALTSEAIMAGARFEARLSAGPLWAYLRFGADGIVFFDPFWFQLSAFAELGAGITIDIDLGWFGHIRITIAIHLHADVLVEGPEVRGEATIDLGVCSATIRFGNWSGSAPPAMLWPAFKTKYLVSDEGDGPRIFSVTPGKGQQAPSPKDSSKPPTGKSGDPLLFGPEFTFDVRTRVATTHFVAGSQPVSSIPAQALVALGPMRKDNVTSTLTLHLRQGGSNGAEMIDRLALTPVVDPFPLGVWGPQDQDKPVPKAEMRDAYSGATLRAVATERVAGPEIAANQVETGERHPNPLWPESREWVHLGETLFTLDARAREVLAGTMLATETVAIRIDAGARRRERDRRAPPMRVPVTAGVGTDALPPVEVEPRVAVAVPPPQAPLRPHWVASLRLAAEDLPEAPARTRLTASAPIGARVRPRLRPVAPPRLESVIARASEVGIILKPIARPAVVAEHTVTAAILPKTRGRLGGLERRRARAGSARLASPGVRDDEALEVRAGEVSVYSVRGAGRGLIEPRRTITLGRTARVVFLEPMGNVITGGSMDEGTHDVPEGTGHIAIVGGALETPATAVVGWHDRMRLAQVGAWTLLGPGCSVHVDRSQLRRRGREVVHGWTSAGQLGDAPGRIETRFETAPATVGVILELLDPQVDLDDIDLAVTGGELRGSPHSQVVGGRLVLVQAVSASGAVSVLVDSTESLHVAGVVASGLDEAALLEVLARGPTPTLAPLAHRGPSTEVRFTGTPHSDDEGRPCA